MSCGFHHAYCKPCQNSRAWRIRRISCRRATIPSSRYCTTSSRSAFTRSGRSSSSRSLFGPRACFASASCTFAAGCLPSIPNGARAPPAPNAVCGPFAVSPPPADEPSSGATLPSFGASASPFRMAMSFKLLCGFVMVFSRTGFSLSLLTFVQAQHTTRQAEACPTRAPFQLTFPVN
jgi:hypothetical protein